MITLKEYAKERGVSYEAVRKQVVRYRGELREHIVKKDRTQYLDDEGVALLDKKRASNPIIILEHDKDQQIETLKAQLDAEKEKNGKLKDQIIILQNQKIEDTKQIGELREKLALLTVKKAEEDKKEPPETEPSKGKEERKGFWQRLFGL